MRRTQAFTLIEILVTIVVIGTLAAIAVPVYTSTIEQSRSNEAIANLNTIYMAQKIHLIDWGWYHQGDGTGSSQSVSTTNSGDLANMRTFLHVDITPQFYDISITSAGLASSNNATFTATATRNSSSGGNGTTISINQKGCWGGSSPNVPANNPNVTCP